MTDAHGKKIFIIVEGCPFRRKIVKPIHYYILQVFFELENYKRPYNSIPFQKQTYIYKQCMDIVGSEYRKYKDFLLNKKGN